MKILKSILATLALVAGVAAPMTQAQLFGGKAKPAAVARPAFGSINLNRDSQKELERLPGIGPKIAREIIKNRPYRDGKELQDKVKGIGPKTWAEIKPYIKF